MKPWRDVIHPNADVLAGTLQAAEFAADLSAVHEGKATAGYQDARTFYARTYVTAGLATLLKQVVRRLNGTGGDPVINLQTSFGGGKTHSLLAVYHLATRTGSARTLAGLSTLLDEEGIQDVPVARVVVLDGVHLSPAQARVRSGVSVRTLWGELAWQLGGAEAYASVAEADANGGAPGKAILEPLLRRYAPCVVLLDELVAYVRQLPGAPGGAIGTMPGGTYDSAISFVQALTEAVKQVPGAILLGSLPESMGEVGGQAGQAALAALGKLFGRVDAVWQPVSVEESFEVVRRRLFDPVRDESGRDETCASFLKLYTDQEGRVPSAATSAEYRKRLERAYPLHPELLDRLYGEWSMLPKFQRTRGVLKLMARVVHRLWKDQDRDGMILPGSLPLHDPALRSDLLELLGPGWGPVLDRDVDGEHAESTRLDVRDPRFGAVAAGRRVARTLFLATAPGTQRVGTARGVDVAHLLLGALQPGQAASTYVDALGQLANRWHHANTTADSHTGGNPRYWLDVRANLRREAEERKARCTEGELRTCVKRAVETLVARAGSDADYVKAVHVFVPWGDVPDQEELRLVVVAPPALRGHMDGAPPAAWDRHAPQDAVDTVTTYVRTRHGGSTRERGNRLLFLLPDAGGVARLLDVARGAVAWSGIVEDIEGRRLVVDRTQEDQARKDARIAADALTKATRDVYRWLAVPHASSPTDLTIQVDAEALGSNGSFWGEVARTCREHAWVIEAWAPSFLAETLRETYWVRGKTDVNARTLWDNTTKFVFHERLSSRDVLTATIVNGAVAELLATAEDVVDVKDADGHVTGRAYQGLRFGGHPRTLHANLLLVEPEAAKAQMKPPPTIGPQETDELEEEDNESENDDDKPPPPPPIGPTTTTTTPATFFASTSLPTPGTEVRVAELERDLLALLTQDPHAKVTVTLEVRAEFPRGVDENLKRSVRDNATTLKVKTHDWS